MNESVKNVKDAIYEDLLYPLTSIIENDTEENIDVYEYIHQEVDNEVSSNDRSTNLEIIDDTGNEEYVDDGLVDRNADITMQIAQTAYGCLEQELFNDDQFSTIMRYFDDPIDKDQAEAIKAEVEDLLK